MTTRFRRSAALAALALPLALLTACGGSSDDSAGSDASGGGLELTALDYYTDEPSHGNTQKRLSDCAAEVGATITQSSVPSAQYNAKVLQQISTKSLPDVLMVNNPDLPQFASTGALAPLSDLGVDTSAYLPSVLETGRYEDELYGLAPNVNTLVLYYNTTMLQEAGLAVPTTWAELEAAAAQLTTPDRYGFAYSAAAGTEGTWTFVPFLWSNGGSQLQLTAPEAQEALSFYTGLAAKGYVSQSVVNWTQADVKDQFAAGKAAMMINGPWQIPSLEETAGLDWASTTIPVPQAGDTPVAPLGGELWTVPRTGGEREEAAASIVQCLNSPETQLEMATTSNTVPSNQEAAQQLAQQQPEMQSIVDTVTTAKSLTGDSGLKWTKVSDELATAIAAVITGQASVPDALQAAQSAING
ncbi:extracellular solute-binding protein [Kineococcus sp. T13]|uniref:sugar ABC transporter substrate-binding protein n=1 Tax=Kineococcus vitellinus TaxID=2696565 RepID=UPI0014133414|nr:sugar ABC transporter substrate-binding protein [Kineococcus vitellinus]NAZ75440.1 extracellular solute-binding protein [Kineococcus vitellinus]